MDATSVKVKTAWRSLTNEQKVSRLKELHGRGYDTFVVVTSDDYNDHVPCLNDKGQLYPKVTWISWSLRAKKYRKENPVDLRKSDVLVEVITPNGIDAFTPNLNPGAMKGNSKGKSTLM